LAPHARMHQDIKVQQSACMGLVLPRGLRFSVRAGMIIHEAYTRAFAFLRMMTALQPASPLLAESALPSLAALTMPLNWPKRSSLNAAPGRVRHLAPRRRACH